MVWKNPPKLIPTKPKAGKRVTPEQLAGDSEHSQQVSLFIWASYNFNKYPQLKFMFAIPNGGLRDVRTASSLKAEGVKAGVLDIFLPWPNSKWSGLFIEMKWGKNRLTEEQKEFIAFAQLYYDYSVCYSWEEARDTLVGYLEDK